MTAMKQQRPKRVAVPKRKESKPIGSNAFAALSEQNDKKVVAVPKVMKPKAAAGSWSKKPDLSKEAIQQRVANNKQVLAVEEDEVKMTPLLTLKEAYAKIQQAPTYIGSWADACDSEDESDDEEEIVLDNLGRPATDNSAW
jgi:hypothetical protein